MQQYPFLEVPATFNDLQSVLLKPPGCGREIAAIVPLILRHDDQPVLCSLALALNLERRFEAARLESAYPHGRATGLRTD